MLEPLPDSSWTRRHADHLLSRAGFGALPVERDAFYQLGRREGVAAAVASIVDAEADWDAWPFPVEALTAREDNGRPDSARRSYATTGWFLGQLVVVPGLHGKMFKFWVDHFPVDVGTAEPEVRFNYLGNHLDLLRRGALGNFGDLVEAVSWSPAMIEMLDLQLSQRGNLNENFARELLELFTVGVDAGYSEADVLALAAALTGRRIRDEAPFDAWLDERVFPFGNELGEYRYIDPSPKTILGRQMAAIPKPADRRPGDPVEHGAEAIRIILGRPECGNHLAWKLWRYFASPDPPAGLVAALGERLRVTHRYDLRPFLRELFASREFHEEDVIGDAIKDPVDLVVSAARLLDRPLLPDRTSTLILSEMGFELVRPPNINGWPEPERRGSQWMAADRVVHRLNFPKLVCHGNIGALTNYEFPDAATLVPEPLEVEPLLEGSSGAFPDLPLAVAALADRFFPLVPLDEAEIDLLVESARRGRPGVPRRQWLRDLVVQLLAHPNFQMQ